MRQHWLSHDVADGKDMLLVGSLLFIDRDIAFVIYRHTRRLGSNVMTIGRATDRDQYRIVCRAVRCLVTLKFDREFARICLHSADPGIQVDARALLFKTLRKRLHQIRVCTGHELSRHLYDTDLAPQSHIDGRHLKPDDAAADHQHPGRNVFERQSTR